MTMPAYDDRAIDVIATTVATLVIAGDVAVVRVVVGVTNAPSRAVTK